MGLLEGWPAVRASWAALGQRVVGVRGVDVLASGVSFPITAERESPNENHHTLTQNVFGRTGGARIEQEIAVRAHREHKKAHGCLILRSLCSFVARESSCQWCDLASAGTRAGFDKLSQRPLAELVEVNAFARKLSL